MNLQFRGPDKLFTFYLWRLACISCQDQLSLVQSLLGIGPLLNEVVHVWHKTESAIDTCEKVTQVRGCDTLSFSVDEVDLDKGVAKREDY